MHKTEPRFLCVHQGYELYGSDRVFLQTLTAIRKEWSHAYVTAHLPQRGPLSVEVEKLVDQVIYGDLWVIRRSRCKVGYMVRGIFNIPQCFYRAWQLSRQHDVIYINTITVLSYLLIARFFRGCVILHAHEFCRGFLRYFFNGLIRFSKAFLVVNSNATSDIFPFARNKTTVWNGTPHPAERTQPANQNAVLNILLLGRMSRWKGHMLALKALTLLSLQKTPVKMRFVGSVFEKETARKEAVVQFIAKHTLYDYVSVYDFNIPEPHYQWADVLIVPSTEPEPFGLVAIEAMARELPVIAAQHGGLLDIVQDGVTGRFFMPGKAKDLARVITYYAANRNEARKHGLAGYQRFLETFQEERYLVDIINVMKRACPIL